MTEKTMNEETVNKTAIRGAETREELTVEAWVRSIAELRTELKRKATNKISLQRIAIITGDNISNPQWSNISFGFFREFVKYVDPDGYHSTIAIIQDRGGRVRSINLDRIIFLDLPNSDFSEFGMHAKHDLMERLK